MNLKQTIKLAAKSIAARKGRTFLTMLGVIIGLAAVIIGEVLFSKVFRNFALKLLSVALGAIIYYLVYQVVIWAGLSTDDMKLRSALLVAVFLSVPYWKGKYFRVKPAKSLSKPESKLEGGDHNA